MSSGTRPSIAFVVPRAGEDVTGGAETLCLAAAREISATADIEILTTCASSYETWANVYDAGPSSVHGIAVRRFPVDQARDSKTFDRLSRQLRYRLSTLTDHEQEMWLREQGPYSTEMLRYLWEERRSYDAVVFFTYLYATTYFGLPLVGDRAYLIPLAHDEWPIYLPVWRSFFQKPRGFLYVSPEERDFVNRRFPGTDGEICYMPLRVPRGGDAAAFRTTFGISDPFLLYVGRIDISKGCNDLCEMFRAYKKMHPQDRRRLIFAGAGGESIKESEDIRALGQIDETTKWNALAACDVFVMPSPYESLSIALLEAWGAAKPAIVNALSAPLVGQCWRSNGGLWYRDQRSFSAVLEMLTPEVSATLGRQGRNFIDAYYADGNMAGAFARLIGRVIAR